MSAFDTKETFKFDVLESAFDPRVQRANVMCSGSAIGLSRSYRVMS